MAGVTGGSAAAETSSQERDKGPLVYQESKVFYSETFLCNVYDNTKTRHVTFEIYGLDTQDTHFLFYDYNSFDKEFRFNAELMNPNRKEGRFHWVIERLAILKVGKERKLERMPEPSEEVPELPIYETGRKIPTGRMDLKERQRLREQMDMLDIKRAENIAKKRAATKEAFLKRLFKMKEEAAQKKEDVEEKIRLEREQRIKTREEEERLAAEEQARLAAQDKLRTKAVTQKEQRTEEQDEEDYRLLRERWRVLDDEKAANIKESHDKKQAELAARQQAEWDEEARQRKLQDRREVIWKRRDSHIAAKEAQVLKRVLDRKAELQRQDRMSKERNQEFLKVLHSERQPIFREQIKRSKQRKFAQEQEREAVATYNEKRALPKRVKTKGKYAVRAKEPHDKSHGLRKKDKFSKKHEKSEKSGKDEDKSETETEKDRTDKVLEAVEAKVRAEMAEEQRRSNLHNQRMERIDQREQAWLAAEVKHMQQYREANRRKERKEEENAAERQLVMKQRDEERAEAAERKQRELDRLQKVREHNVARREQERLAALRRS